MKKLFKENKLLFCMAVIIIISLIIILIMMFTYFYNGNGNDKYGARLRDISSHPVAKDFDSKLSNLYGENDGVKSIKHSVSGKIIYINYVFKEGNDVNKAHEQVNRSLEAIDNDTKSYYDLQFIVTNENKQEKAFPTLGYKNSSNESIVWTNYKEITNDEEATNEEE